MGNTTVTLSAYTCLGYDAKRKLQFTTGCCQHLVLEVVEIGMVGELSEEEMKEAMEQHPLHDSFNLSSA
ncbi:hypothetical protein [Vibrio mediterranei]|uniref:Uncharacterized protein n=1 Tax=Vibrio mediterranei TaxID=689 RepID=A0ABX5D404_9VIBR|nr:hypothetical protein [Vibrio mediterranei]PRQ64419.1 hypothetical protein COR51_27635 [Vibrio mediterranei]